MRKSRLNRPNPDLKTHMLKATPLKRAFCGVKLDTERYNFSPKLQDVDCKVCIIAWKRVRNPPVKYRMHMKNPDPQYSRSSYAICTPYTVDRLTNESNMVTCKKCLQILEIQVRDD